MVRQSEKVSLGRIRPGMCEKSGRGCKDKSGRGFCQRLEGHSLSSLTQVSSQLAPPGPKTPHYLVVSQTHILCGLLHLLQDHLLPLPLLQAPLRDLCFICFTGWLGFGHLLLFLRFYLLLLLLLNLFLQFFLLCLYLLSLSTQRREELTVP